MKKKTQGFTLIELLTVIAILAIILLIAAPTILGVLDKARKNTFKNQALLYVEALKTEVALSATGNSDMNLTLPNVGENKEIDISTIPMDTNPGYTGSIIITNKGNNKYTYTLSGVSSKEYKITEDVEATKLEVSKITKADEKVEESNKPVTYLAYNIGDSVTLKDGSTWFVIENSDSSSDTVTLFASQNIKNDATGWTDDFDDYVTIFDEANVRTPDNGNTYCTSSQFGCNIYAAQSSVVTNGSLTGMVVEDSSIKKFLDNEVKSYINGELSKNSGSNIKEIKLMDMNLICSLINTINNDNSCDPINTLSLNDVNAPSWLTNTYYWLATPYEEESAFLVYVGGDGDLYTATAVADYNAGARPIIVIEKSNIK